MVIQAKSNRSYGSANIFLSVILLQAATGIFGDRSFLTILVYFLKVSFVVFGSGLAIVPFLYGGVVHGHHWLTDRQFVDAVAVAMLTPGPVVITVAFIGYLIQGLGRASAA